jgi:predicted DNA-binding protein (MmcQ/YjbR family)
VEIEEIQQLCLGLPGVTEEIKWEHNLCFSVAGKIFLLVSLDESPPRASFKVREDDFDGICCKTGFRQAPYFARNKWVMVEDITLPDQNEWKTFIKTSYELVKLKLPAKTRKEIEDKI